MVHVCACVGCATGRRQCWFLCSGFLLSRGASALGCVAKWGWNAVRGAAVVLRWADDGGGAVDADGGDRTFNGARLANVERSP